MNERKEDGSTLCEFRMGRKSVHENHPEFTANRPRGSARSLVHSCGAWCLSDCAGVCLRADQPLVPGGLEHVRVKCGTAFVWGGTLRLVRRQKQSDVGCCMAAANGTPDHVTLAGCLDHRSKGNRRHFYDRQRGCQEQRSGADASGHCQCS